MSLDVFFKSKSTKRGESAVLLPPARIKPPLTDKEKRQVVEEAKKCDDELERYYISKSSISLFSWEKMKRIAPVHINSPELVNTYGHTTVNDPRMGLINNSGIMSITSPCQYCGKINCPGHFGVIDFGLKVYNPIYIRNVVQILTCICNDCGKLLCSEDLYKEKGWNRLTLTKRLSEMEKGCKGLQCTSEKKQLKGAKTKDCKMNPEFSISESKLRESGQITFKSGVKGESKEIPMDINRVYEILDHISDEIPEGRTLSDVRMLGFSEGSHPRDLILQGILVPPIIARPPKYQDGSIAFDQLTILYANIAKNCPGINKSQEYISQSENVKRTKIFFELKRLIFKSEGKRYSSRDFASIIERFQGKTAILRGLLMGKRVDYCGRTVAGPDPSLKFGQIRIPAVWCPVLTKKVTVTSFNITYLKGLLADGHITHITQRTLGTRFLYNKETYKSELRIGDIVDRYLQNGDRIIINRQPTLHRQSIMAYEVVLGKELSIGLHLSYTSPMNCDFDGDENNAWNPQDFEVEAEAAVLMDVRLNVMSSEQNRPSMGMVMNSVSGAFILTDDRTMVKQKLFDILANMLTNKDSLKDRFHERLDRYKINRLSGKAVFSMLLPSDFYYDYGGILIIEGILILGKVKKSNIGASNHSIIQELWKKYGRERTADFYTDAPWIINKWIIERGFSVGISDCISYDKDTGEDKNQEVIKKELAQVYVGMDALDVKTEDKIEEDFKQIKIKELVDAAERIGLLITKQTLGKDNSIGVMTDQGGGAKGGLPNIGQMMGVVGQQFYRGKRLRATITNNTRLLPCFDENDRNPEANGFIPQSLFNGISPAGLFFLQAGGREGLLDTALKTADTGSMQHRMFKAFENVVIGYDGSIRNTIGTIFSPMYNAGFDIAEMIDVPHNNKSNFSSFIDLKSVMAELNIKRGWVESGVPINIEATAGKGAVAKIDLTPMPMEEARFKITKFEKARIIGTRAMQLSNDDDPKIDIEDEKDPVNIALQEYETGQLPIFVVRKFADGSREEVYPTRDNI